MKSSKKSAIYMLKQVDRISFFVKFTPCDFHQSK